MQQTIKNLTAELEHLQEILTKMNVNETISKETGYLRISANNGKPKYYYIDHNDLEAPKKGRYLPKTNMAAIEELAQTEYEAKLQKILQKQIFVITRFLNNYKENCVAAFYDELHPARQELIHPVEIPDDEYAAKWQATPYQKKFLPEDNLSITTERGESVRSKSEKIIADALHYANIPYRYECPLNFNQYGTFHPDFTILRIRDRKEIIWEHFGMMSNPEYADQTIDKIELFQSQGYVLGDTLLVTFETDKSPLKTSAVTRNIKLLR